MKKFNIGEAVTFKGLSGLVTHIDFKKKEVTSTFKLKDVTFLIITDFYGDTQQSRYIKNWPKVILK